MTEENVVSKDFCFSFWSISYYFLVDIWKSYSMLLGKETLKAWAQDPLHVRPIAHAIWDPLWST